MLRKFMIIPNALLLATALYLFFGVYLSGRVTGIGSVMILSGALPLIYCFWAKLWLFFRLAATLLNLALFLLCGYVFSGTVYVLFKAGFLGVPFYIALAAVWLAALALACFWRRGGAKSLLAGIALNVILCVAAGWGLYCRAAMHWLPWMNAVMFGMLLAVTGLNVYMFIVSFIKPKRLYYNG